MMPYNSTGFRPTLSRNKDIFSPSPSTHHTPPQPERTQRTREARPGVYRERDGDGEGALDEAGVEPGALGRVAVDDAHVEEHVVDVWEDLREADGVDEPDEAERQELPPRDRRHRPHASCGGAVVVGAAFDVAEMGLPARSGLARRRRRVAFDIGIGDEQGGLFCRKLRH